MNPKDHQAALRDAILIRAGDLCPNSHSCHPLAASFAERDENILRGLAESCCPPAAGRSSPGAALASGLTSSDFKVALASAFNVVTVRAFEAHAGHLKITTPVDVANFRQHEFTSVDIDFSLTEVNELSELTAVSSINEAAGLPAQVKSYGRNLLLSRQLIINDNVGLAAGLFRQIGAAAARHEAAMVYSLIESNPTLADDMPMFHGDHGNVQASALDESSLGAAMGKLRLMQTPLMEPVNLAAAVLVVAPDLELGAIKLAHQCNLNLAIVCSVWLPPGRWYLGASPELSPYVGILRLRGSESGVRVGPSRKKFERDGVPLGVRLDTGVVALGRIGIVKGGA
ncbi:MAG: phage major capsid protein [Rhodocyclaceae bacterium]